LFHYEKRFSELTNADTAEDYTNQLYQMLRLRIAVPHRKTSVPFHWKDDGLFAAEKLATKPNHASSDDSESNEDSESESESGTLNYNKCLTIRCFDAPESTMYFVYLFI
jgi:hypothetical protein